MILDGVVDTDQYYSAKRSTAIQDTDKTLRAFFEECVRVGFRACPLAELGQHMHSSQAAAHLEQIFWAFAERLKQTPILAPQALQPAIVTYDRLLSATYDSLSVVTSYAEAASALAPLFRGSPTDEEVTAFANWVQSHSPLSLSDA